jgi:hypothetical protein
VLSPSQALLGFLSNTGFRQSLTAIDHPLDVILRTTPDILQFSLPGGEGPQARMGSGFWVSAKVLVRRTVFWKKEFWWLGGKDIRGRGMWMEFSK